MSRRGIIWTCGIREVTSGLLVFGLFFGEVSGESDNLGRDSLLTDRALVVIRHDCSSFDVLQCVQSGYSGPVIVVRAKLREKAGKKHLFGTVEGFFRMISEVE